MDKKQKKTLNNDYRKYVKYFWIASISFIFSIALLFLLASWNVFGKLPNFEDLENPEDNFASEVISSDGKILGKFFIENRTPISYNNLPKELVNAVVSTEDERFYNHSGIDYEATLRAVLKFGTDGGGSTITQQLAKMLFHERGHRNIADRILQKVKEYIIAVRLEHQYTKQEIIAMYFNEYDFLNLAVGIRSASSIYFGKKPKQLSIEQSAMLVGMLKNSSYYNPLRVPERVKRRRNVVLRQMLKNNFVTEKEKDSLQKLDLQLDVHRESHRHGIATYFREQLRGYLKKWIKENPKSDGTKYNLHRDGLKIYVTIDSRMQLYAEEATKEHMKNLQRIFFKEQQKNSKAPFYNLTKSQVEKTISQAMKRSERWRIMKKNGTLEKDIVNSFYEKKNMRVFSWNGEKDTIMTPRDSIKYYKHFLRAGMLSVDPKTGYIKAWVGGINYKHFQFDAIEQQKRQVGSVFKPFVYAAAINQLKLSPCEKYSNTLYTIPKGKYGISENWTPNNSGGRYGGEVTLKDALARSLNVISARLIDMVGPQTVVRLAKSSGIESEIPPYPSIALGSVDLSLMEMIGAYTTFANKGLKVEPISLLKIEDMKGTVLEQFVPETKEVLSEESSYVITKLLEGVTKSGTGRRLRSGNAKFKENVVTGYPYKFTNPIAGKTGTTQNQSDGWFMASVPNLTTGVWVGAEDRSVHFKSGTYGQGAAMALPIWALYHKKLYADESLKISQENFEKPDNLTIEIDCNDDEEEFLEMNLDQQIDF